LRQIISEMRKIIVIIFFLLFYNLTFGQDSKDSFWKQYIDSDIQKLNLRPFENQHYEKAYRIWKNSYQVVELIKINDTTYLGQLVNYVNKVTKRAKGNKTIFQKLIIPDGTVKLLIEKLSSENIENLQDSDKVNGYINGLDGITYVFEISSNNQNRIYSYWEPENVHYQNSEIIEVKHVRNILNAIKTEMDTERLFAGFIDSLDIGTYHYSGIEINKFLNTSF